MLKAGCNTNVSWFLNITPNVYRLNDSFYLRINIYKMKKTEGQIIAQEVWNMLTDNAKKEMKGLKKSFMESIAADVDAVVNKNFALADVSWQSELLKCQCKKAQFTRTVDSDFNPLCGRCGKAL